MRSEKILEILKTIPSENIESENIEFKNYESERSLHNSKDLADEISAIANQKGGKILIGVVDSCEVKNNNWSSQLNGFDLVDIDTTKERLLGKIRPKINISLRNIEFEGKNYLEITIPNVVHSLVSTSSGKVHIREGKSSVPCEPYQIQQLVKNLQSYDWSSEDLNLDIIDSLDSDAVMEAKIDFCKRKLIDFTQLGDLEFLESIGATKNGILNRSGLLFLGKSDIIKKNLGLFEFRYSWKKRTGELIINDVWDDCIWNSINRAKIHFKKCNELLPLEYEGKNYVLSTLDEQAFHEAFLNSIVHRDYSVDGMTTVNFKERELVITNPGSFYGGVNSDNISYHEPRHRNKVLGKTLMNFQLVDRAGMGVLRMGLKSLLYGRELPTWTESEDNVEVRMAAEYFRTGVFLLTQIYIPDCSITDLYIINSTFEVGSISLKELTKNLKKIIPDPWSSIQTSLKRKEMELYFELKGNNEGVFVCVKDLGFNLLKVTKKFRASSNSKKHIKLYKYLKIHAEASNEEIMKHLEFAQPSSTYNFLKKLKYVANEGKSRSSRWMLK
ncbi:RNA-binding domain-containing protein [uncultured Polaribacter sp.]|uniref:RNA-binding domain-containing protein n=1 Tax=uncultured Polaribacter sp. TaxID=174711 RepID=UPI00259B0628|nr:RNA-binding domain-containing protein [uncultured Polaribacter sp.]